MINYKKYIIWIILYKPCKGALFASICLLRASIRISIISVANSFGVNLANFCLPWFLVDDNCGLTGRKGTVHISGKDAVPNQTI